jgi:hypothetical protein
VPPKKKKKRGGSFPKRFFFANITNVPMVGVYTIETILILNPKP